MQGINGVALLPSSYNSILDLGGSELERISYDVMETDLDIKLEKDVEEKLVVKLLLELGYNDNDYIRQLYIKVGNNNHLLIPDFVINPIYSPGHQKADFIIEVKYSLLSKKSVETAEIQARGYAKILNAKYSVLASKERVWVMDREDDYSDSILSYTWEKLKEEDNFFELYKIIGKSQIN